MPDKILVMGAINAWMGESKGIKDEGEDAHNPGWWIGHKPRIHAARRLDRLGKTSHLQWPQNIRSMPGLALPFYLMQ